jgi:hypothetical protein
LAFGLGVVSRLIRSELSLPRDLYTSQGIYLLLALGLFKGALTLFLLEMGISAGARTRSRQRPGGG